MKSFYFFLVCMASATTYDRYNGRASSGSNDPFAEVHFDPMHLGTVAEKLNNQQEIDEIWMLRVQQMLGIVKDHEQRIMSKHLHIPHISNIKVG